MKVLEVTQEFIPQNQNRNLTGQLARELIAGAQERGYQSGKRPSKQQLRSTVEAMANNLYNDLLQAIDQELDVGSPSGSFRGSA